MKKTISLYCLFLSVVIPHISNAQKKPSANDSLNIKGNITLTNNGFSFIPAFTLGKPAAIAIIAIAKKRLSFEPEIRYSMQGKPWSLVFAWRYKVVNHKKFKLSVGTHLPGLSYINTSVIEGGVVKDIQKVQRFLGIEVAPTYIVSKKIGIGIYNLNGYGLQNEGVQRVTFINGRINVNNIALGKNLLLGFSPQLFYLKLDKKDGIYYALNTSIGHNKIPFSLVSTLYQPIKSTIAGKKFDWNIGVAYSFNRNYLRL